MMKRATDDLICPVCGRPVRFHPGGGQRPIYPQDCIALLLAVLRESEYKHAQLITEREQLWETILTQKQYISNMNIQADQLAAMAQGYLNTAKAQSDRIIELERELRKMVTMDGE